MTSAAVIERARELDDGLPLDTCPGCGRDITGWQHHEAHYLGDLDPAEVWPPWHRPVAWPWHDGRGSKYLLFPLCPWTHDYLTARVIRRRIAQQTT